MDLTARLCLAALAASERDVVARISHKVSTKAISPGSGHKEADADLRGLSRI